MGAAATRLSDKEKAALGDGPDVDRLGERDVGEARSSERRDRRAAEGRERPPPETTGESGGSEAMPTNKTRIPPPGDAFVEWFDSLSLSELDRLLADRSVKGGPRGARDVIEDCIRHPGDPHEWLMVAEARQFKKWGVSMRTIQESRTLTLAAIGKSFRHGGTGPAPSYSRNSASLATAGRRGTRDLLLGRVSDRMELPAAAARSAALSICSCPSTRLGPGARIAGWPIDDTVGGTLRRSSASSLSLIACPAPMTSGSRSRTPTTARRAQGRLWGEISGKQRHRGCSYPSLRLGFPRCVGDAKHKACRRCPARVHYL